MKAIMAWKRFGMWTLLVGLAWISAGSAEAAGLNGPIRVKQFGTPERDQVSGISLNRDGDMFFVGATHGNIGGPPQGGSDIWLERTHRRQGSQWVRQFGTEENDNCASATALDGPDGSVYVASSTPGSMYRPNGGGEDLVVARFDASGSLMWGQQIAVAFDQCHGGGQLALDAQGGVYVSGATGGDFGALNAGGDDAFLVHYDKSGNLLWIRQFGTSGSDYAEAVAPDGTGGAYVVGYTNGNLGGPAAGYDVWLARFDSGGNRRWIRQFGSAAADWAMSATPIGDGRTGVLIGGGTGGSLGGPYAGQVDGWLARYSSDGTRVWIQQFGKGSNDFVTYLTTGAGDVYVTGWTDGDLAGSNAGERDIFVMQYSLTGGQKSSTQFGTDASDEAWTLEYDPVGGVLYVGGWTMGSLGGPHLGERDAFVATLGRHPHAP
jgi:hypothetical protein